MRASNKLVKDWLLENEYDQIWFKAHTKRNDLVYTQKGNYLATDLWNLFDGICFNLLGNIVFLQMKTNAWPKADPIKKFVKDHPSTQVIVFNVTNKLKKSKKKYIVETRFYE
jgi:hypothetical protein